MKSVNCCSLFIVLLAAAGSISTAEAKGFPWISFEGIYDWLAPASVHTLASNATDSPNATTPAPPSNASITTSTPLLNTTQSLNTTLVPTSPSINSTESLNTTLTTSTPFLNTTQSLNSTEGLNTTLTTISTPLVNTTESLNVTAITTEAPIFNTTQGLNSTEGLNTTLTTISTPLVNTTESLNVTAITTESPIFNTTVISNTTLPSGNATTTTLAPPPGGSFVCTQEGRFPDPRECTAFHICVYVPESDYYQDNSFTCPPDLIYCPASEVCAFEAECDSVSC